MHRGKVIVIGAGYVGSTCAYTLMHSGIFSDICIIDINKDKAEGDALDMSHGAAFTKAVKVTAGDYKECKDADMIIITAGANQKPGETRIDLLRRNAAILKDIIDNIKNNTENYPILLVVSNPVDVLTYITYKLSGWPVKKVIGSGTVLDTSRFKYMLSNHTGIDARNIHTYIIGEHGDSEIAVWSATKIGGLSIDEYCANEHCANDVNSESSLDNMLDEVRNAAYEIIEKKGATYYAIALAVERIVSAIINDEHSVLTISSVLENKYGISDVCLSVPTVVDGNGIVKVLEAPLNESELDGLKNSAEKLSELLRELGF